jgi:rhomboid protease GluP
LPPLSFTRKCKWCKQYEAVQRGEVPDDAPQVVIAAPWQRPVSNSRLFTQILVGLNVLVFAAMVFSGVSPLQPSGETLVAWGANFGPYALSNQWWRLFTCLFLHIGIIHLLFNMWCLWDLGSMAEHLYGRWSFLGIYLVSGFAASVSSIFWRPSGLSAGASGAIFGLAGALLASFYLGEFDLPREALGGVTRSLGFFVFYNLAFGAMSGRTDNAAHIGGLLSGIVLGALIARLAPDSDAFKARLLILLVVAGMTFALFWHLRSSQAYLLQYESGCQFYENGQIDQAVGELRRSIARNPDFAPSRLLLSEIDWKKGDYAAAEQQLRQVVAMDPHNRAALYNLGLAQMEQHNFTAAIQSLQRAQAQEDDREVGEALDSAYRGQGMRQQAASDTDAAQRRTILRPLGSK